jgi:hypothetical protein
MGTYGIEKTLGEEGSKLFPVLASQARIPPDAVDSERIEAAFGKLMRGLAHMSEDLIYSGYRALYELGTAAIPALERRIFQANWKTVTRPEATRMQTALVSLLHDIDEARSRNVIDRLLAQDCHPALRGVLQSIRRYDGGDFGNHEISGVRVLVAREIDESGDVAFHMARWLANVPPEDLVGIARLYVVPRPPVQDTAGHYMPVLSTITVYWKDSLLGNKSLAWLARISVEQTLYHEIGHHVHRHTFGRQPEQEKEADRYAYARLRVSRPFLTGIVRAIRLFVPRKTKRR